MLVTKDFKGPTLILHLLDAWMVDITHDNLAHSRHQYKFSPRFKGFVAGHSCFSPLCGFKHFHSGVGGLVPVVCLDEDIQNRICSGKRLGSF